MPYWDDSDYFQPTQRIHTDKGLKTRSQRGKIGQSWWAAAWIAALEQFTDAGRLTRGRSYARSGQVLSLDEQGAAVTARVQGSRPQPYKVTITLKPLTDAAWDRAIDAMAAEARFAAQLLAGEMPQGIAEAFQAAGVSLFPTSMQELTTNCSCPDPANPCKHIAATHYILGEQFDDDPFMLFRLRGRTQQQVLDALAVRRKAGLAVAEEAATYDVRAPQPSTPPLQDLVAVFWEPAAPLDVLAVTPASPTVTLPVLRRLGKPGFLPEQDLTGLLASAYNAVSQAALKSEE